MVHILASLVRMIILDRIRPQAVFESFYTPKPVPQFSRQLVSPFSVRPAFCAACDAGALSKSVFSVLQDGS